MDVSFAGISVWARVIDNTDETRDRKESGEDHKRIVYMKILSAVVYGRRLKRSGDPTHSYDSGVSANEAEPYRQSVACATRRV